MDACVIFSLCILFGVSLQVFYSFMVLFILFFFFLKHKTAYELRISDWSSDVCSSDLPGPEPPPSTRCPTPPIAAATSASSPSATRPRTASTSPAPPPARRHHVRPSEPGDLRRLPDERSRGDVAVLRRSLRLGLQAPPGGGVPRDPPRPEAQHGHAPQRRADERTRPARVRDGRGSARDAPQGGVDGRHGALRSEEHTSELQSLMRISYAVFCLKKKKI